MEQQSCFPSILCDYLFIIIIIIIIIIYNYYFNTTKVYYFVPLPVHSSDRTSAKRTYI